MKTFKLLNVKLNSLDCEQVLKLIKKNFTDDPGQQNQLCTVNPEFLVSADKDDEFKKILNQAYINTVDGFGIKLAGLLHGKFIKRCCGVDLIDKILADQDLRSKRIYLLGGKPGIARLTSKKIQKKYKNANIVGYSPGFVNINDYSLNELNSIIGDIINKEPDILLVGYNAPFAQKFIEQWQRKLSSVKLAIGVGGSFDFISGIVKRAPKIFRIVGLEWLWRLIRQPSRFKRIINATIVFLYLVIKYYKKDANFQEKN